jgi:predicted transcriptional regulator
MSIEILQNKIDNQNKLIKELTNENEELYHQYNHLMIRNGKMLKRIDDLQRIIDDLHIRIEELQLINGNMLQINDKLRRKNDIQSGDSTVEIRINNNLNAAEAPTHHTFDLDALCERWKKFPGQTAQNGPNLKKQVLMLVSLYSKQSLRAAELFSFAGVGGVTGARYVSALKKYGLICFTGARKKGHYEITPRGVEFLENTGIKDGSFHIPSHASEPLINQIGIETGRDERFASIRPAVLDHNDL